MVYLPTGSSRIFFILGCMTSNFLYLSFSTLYSSSLWRTYTIVFAKFNVKPPDISSHCLSKKSHCHFQSSNHGWKLRKQQTQKFLQAKHTQFKQLCQTVSVTFCTHRVNTGPGNPGGSWNFIVTFSRTRKSWKILLVLGRPGNLLNWIK